MSDPTPLRTANILAFPRKSGAPATIPVAPAQLPVMSLRWRDITLADVIAELGLQQHSTRTAIEKLRALARHSGLPLPRNPRIVDGVPVAGADNICARSVWDRGEFLAWRDFHRTAASTPPGIARPHRAQLRRTLAARAQSIAGAA